MPKTAARPPLKILFVCFGNSCRSQMAEAWARHLAPEKVRAFSAGSWPLGTIAAGTYEVMQEKGLALEGQTSKGLRDVPLATMDVVVTMGREVDCPVPEDFKGRIIDWDIPDPYNRDLEFYRSVRDLIELQVRVLLDDLNEKAESSSPRP
jgi:arsenate reductase